MIEFKITIQQEGKGVTIRRTAEPGTATPMEISVADTLRGALDDFNDRLKTANGKKQKVDFERGDPFCVLDAWKDFLRECYDEPLPPAQQDQLKETFYAGALACFLMLLKTRRLAHNPELQRATVEKIRQELEFYLNMRTMKAEIRDALPPDREGGAHAG